LLNREIDVARLCGHVCHGYSDRHQWVVAMAGNRGTRYEILR